VAIVDCNRWGQSQQTAFGHHLEIYRRRFEGCGWRAVAIDGHDIEEILRNLEMAERGSGPFAIIAKTIKGKGIPFAEDKPDWHGKALSKEQAKQVIELLRPRAKSGIGLPIPKPSALKVPAPEIHAPNEPDYYEPGKKIATRKAYGHALARLGRANSRIIALDGDVENSTYAIEFNKEFPFRFVESYIAEQNMIGMSVGLAALGKIPFASTFATFFSRAFDQIRMAAISQSNIKLCGSHCGVSIGEDGPSQMGLEDLAMMRAVHGSFVFYPSDAISTERLMERMLDIQGICYLRTSRPETPVLYGLDETFEPGGAKVLRQSDRDVATVCAAGVTVFEALAAADELKSQGVPIRVIDCYSIKPVPRDVLLEAARKTNQQLITVEDHYPEGGLGDAIAGELSRDGVRVHKLAIRELPHSGTSRELLEKYGIDSKAIIRQVLEIAKRTEQQRVA
jgi:transketolase